MCLDCHICARLSYMCSTVLYVLDCLTCASTVLYVPRLSYMCRTDDGVRVRALGAAWPGRRPHRPQDHSPAHSGACIAIKIQINGYDLYQNRLDRPFPCRHRIKSSFSIVLICTTRRRIPASASTNQGPETGDLILLWRSIRTGARRNLATCGTNQGS